MNKLSLYPRTIILGTVMLGLMFVGVSVRADQVFLFTDDLSTQFDVDQSQTSAKFNLGRFSVADDSVSSAVVSKIIANPLKIIVSARLDASVYMPSNAIIIYYLSNNNGFRWMQINPGFTYRFDSVGSELRWKAIIARESPVVASAHIDSVNITYNVSDSITPSSYLYSNSNENSGSFGTVLYGNGGDLQTFVCGTLSSIGLGCGAPQKVATLVYGQSSQESSVVVPQHTPEKSSKKNTGDSSYLQASIANITVKRATSDDEVILVKMPVSTLLRTTDSYRIVTNEQIKPTLGLSTNDAIFEIIRGQKHFIPTIDIFFDYGFDLSAVQSVTNRDLEPFPRVKLANVYKDTKKNYYITEGYMIRLIPNKRVFDSYGDREEDMITISKKEFNWYPRDQFVFLGNPLNRDVYQLVDRGKIKRYLTPAAVQRMQINPKQIAPINETELLYYKTQKPIVM